MARKDSFCFIPWVSAQIMTDGKLHICPSMSRNRPSSASVLDGLPMHQILNTEQTRAIRREMMRGALPSECGACAIVERGDGRSLRKAIESGLEKQLDAEELLRRTHEDGTLPGAELKYLELRLGRVCNLRCRFCNPGNSTSWDADYEKLYGMASPQARAREGRSPEWHETDEFLSWFRAAAPSLSVLQFAGGEPLLSRSHRRVLDLLLEEGHAGNISLVYTTNGTIDCSEFFPSWKMFRYVQIFVSVEGIGSNYEYQRWPAKWASTEANLASLAREVGSSISKLTLQPHLNIYNVFSAGELALWCLRADERIGWNKHLNFLTDPDWQSAFSLSAAQKALASRKLELERDRIAAEIPGSERKENVLHWLSAAGRMICDQDWSHLREKSRTMNQKLDRIRKIRAEDYLDPLTLSVLCDPS